MAKKQEEITEQIRAKTKEPPKKEVKEKKRLLTGNTLRDIILGGRKGVLGVKTGIIWNMIGNASAGKTFESTEFIAINRKIYKDKFKWNFDLTSEAGNDINCQKLYGFDAITKDSLRSETVEELSINIKKFLSTLKKGDIACYIVDSLDGVVSQEIKKRIKEREKAAAKGKDFDEGSYLMQKAKYLKQEFFPEIKPLIEKSNCLLIIISQQTEKTGIVFGTKRNRAGGTALRYFSHIESWVRQCEKIQITKKGQTRTIGVRNLTEFTRTRNDRPFRQHHNIIYFDYGIDDLSNNLDFLFNLITDSGKNKSNFNIEYEGQEFTTKRSLINYIEKKNLENNIKQAVIDKWEDIEESIKMDRKKKY